MNRDPFVFCKFTNEEDRNRKKNTKLRILYYLHRSFLMPINIFHFVSFIFPRRVSTRHSFTQGGNVLFALHLIIVN